MLQKQLAQSWGCNVKRQPGSHKFTGVAKVCTALSQQAGSAAIGTCCLILTTMTGTSRARCMSGSAGTMSCPHAAELMPASNCILPHSTTPPAKPLLPLKAKRSPVPNNTGLQEHLKEQAAQVSCCTLLAATQAGRGREHQITLSTTDKPSTAIPAMSHVKGSCDFIGLLSIFCTSAA